MLFACVAHLSWRCTAFLQPVPLHSELTLCCDVLQLSWDFFFFFSHLGHAGTRPSAACVWNWALCREESSIIRAAFYLKTITWAEVFLWGFDASRAQLSLKWWDLLLSHLSPFLRTPGAMRRRRTVTLHDGSVWNARDGLMKTFQAKGEATCVFTVSVDPVLKKTQFFTSTAHDRWQLCATLWDEITWHTTWYIDSSPGNEPIGSASQGNSGEANLRESVDKLCPLCSSRSMRYFTASLGPTGGPVGVRSWGGEARRCKTSVKHTRSKQRCWTKLLSKCFFVCVCV